MTFTWVGLAAVARAVSAVIFAELILAFFMHGYNDDRVLAVLVAIGGLFMVLGCYQFRGSKHD
jgi:hypothetical protein